MRWTCLLLSGGLLLATTLWLRARARTRRTEAEQLTGLLQARGQALRACQASQAHDEALATRTGARRAEANRQRQDAAAIDSGEQRPRLVRAHR